MVRYELNSTIHSPGSVVTFIEFSPDGRFVAIGDHSCSLYILDKLAGFHPTISSVTHARPTALVWETTTAFYVGLGDGCFFYYQVDLNNKRLVEGAMNKQFRGPFPITAIALDAKSETLVSSLGPGVYAFKRKGTTSEFRFVAEISTRFHFKRDPGVPPPFPQSICFLPNNVLVVAYSQQNIVSLALEFDGSLRMHPSFLTAKVDYSGFPLLESIISAGEDEIHRFARFWVYCGASRGDDEASCFLFVNGGAATLSSSVPGAAVVKDVVTKREVQRLDHTDVTGRYVSAVGYHVSNDRYTIATADVGAGATVKIWIAERNFRPPSQINNGPRARKLLCIIVALMTMTVFATFALSQMPEFLNTRLFTRYLFKPSLIFVELCIKIWRAIVGATETVFLAAVALD